MSLLRRLMPWTWWALQRTPPVNVRVELADGAGGWREVPVELVHVGVVVGPDGGPLHRWVAVTTLGAPMRDFEDLPRLSADSLPARAVLELEVQVTE